jgi:hypothetical protein
MNGQTSKSIQAFEAYLAADPRDGNAASVRKYLETLRSQVTQAKK